METRLSSSVPLYGRSERQVSAVRQVIGVHILHPDWSSTLCFIGPYVSFSISSSNIPIRGLPRSVLPPNINILLSITIVNSPFPFITWKGMTTHLPITRNLQMFRFANVVYCMCITMKCVQVKSKLDWDGFKSSEGIDDELKIHNRGKAGYICTSILT